MTRRVSGLSMTGSVSSAAWPKRSSAMRRSSSGRRNAAGVATRSCTVLPPLALAGSLTLAGSMTAQTSVVIDDEYLLDAAGRESSAQLVKRQARGDHRRITAHHRADQQVVDPPNIFWAPDRQTAQMEAPGRKGIAEPMPYHDRGGDDPDHDTDGR